MILFSRDDERHFVRPVRRFLACIRKGLSVQEAGEKAGVSKPEFDALMRQPPFAQAYRQARTGKPRAQLFVFNDTPPEVQISEGWRRLEQLGVVNDPYGVRFTDHTGH
jgi:hypothetical protein